MINRMPKPIETLHAGVLFRSRLEARWAMFFDIISWRWEYEPEGLVLSTGEKYLPDFWLPEKKCYAEVKPEGDDFRLSRQLIADLEAQAHAAETLVYFLFCEGLPGSNYGTSPYWYDGSCDSGCSIIYDPESREELAFAERVRDASEQVKRHRFWEPKK